MSKNRDGLEVGQPVDFETLQRVKRQQREALKNGDSKPKRGKGKAATRKEVREADEPAVQSMADPEES